MAQMVQLSAVMADESALPLPLLDGALVPGMSTSTTSGPRKSTTIKLASLDAARKPTLLSARRLRVLTPLAEAGDEKWNAATGRNPSRSGRGTAAPVRST